MKETHDSADGWNQEYFEDVIEAIAELNALKYEIECCRRISDDPQDLIDNLKEHSETLKHAINNL